MPKVAPELTALTIKQMTYASALRRANGAVSDKDRPVLVAAGGVKGLYLRVTPSSSKSWVLRVMRRGKRQAIGLGSYPEVPVATSKLKDAETGKDVTIVGVHDRARIIKAQIEDGTDVVAQRRERRAADERDKRLAGMNLAAAIAACLAERERHGSLTGRNLDRWQQTLAVMTDRTGKKGGGGFIPKDILAMPVAAIDTSHVLRILRPIWSTKSETAAKLRGRLEYVLNWATIEKYRTGTNPAAWEGVLKKELANIATKPVQPQPALYHKSAPAWFAELRASDDVRAPALQFLAMTAVRSGDVRGAVWREIDLDRAVWTIPAERLKIKNHGSHSVPLAPQAVAILRELFGTGKPADALVFPNLHENSLGIVMFAIHEARRAVDGKGWCDGKHGDGDPAVPHGLRSTFRDWASAIGGYQREFAEKALAHVVKNSTEAAYQRDDLFDQRKPMMTAWADYLHSEARS